MRIPALHMIPLSVKNKTKKKNVKKLTLLCLLGKDVFILHDPGKLFLTLAAELITQSM